MKTLIKPLIVAIIATSTVTYADETAKSDKQETNDTTITVHGMSHLPLTNGITTEQLQKTRASSSDTASLLKQIPGVSVQAGGGVSSIPVIRGMADDRIRIKLDGMDLISACGNHMNPPLSYVDPDQVAEASIIASITPVSLGGDSIGSSIIIESKRPTFAKSEQAELSGSLGLNWRSNASELDTTAEINYATDQFAISYVGSYAEGDNYTAGDDFKAAGPAARGRRDLAADEVGSTYYQAENHALKLAWQMDNHYWQFHYGEQRIPEQGWVNQRMDMTANDSTQYNLSYEGDFSWGNIKARLYQEKTRHSMQFGDDKLFYYGPNNVAPGEDGVPCLQPSMGPNGCANGMPMDTEGDNQGLSVAAYLNVTEDAVLRLGMDLQRYTLDDYWEPSGKGMWPNTFININDGQRDRDAIFAEWEQSLSDQWQINAGIRFESVSMNTGDVQGYSPMMAFYGPESMAFNNADRRREDDNLDITLMSRYQYNKQGSIEVGYAQKTRSPNLYERYTWSTGGMVMRMINMVGDGNGYVGNLDLVPEVAHIISANWRWTEDDWALSISPHYSQIDDYIGARRCRSQNMNCGMMNLNSSTGFVYLQFINESARIYGVDLSFDAILSESDSGGKLSTQITYSLTNGINRQTKDNLPQIMPRNVRLTLSHEYQVWQHDLVLEWVDDKDRLSAVRNEIPTDAYDLLHINGSYTWSDDLKLTYGIENLLDKFYNHPLAGAYLGQGKTMSGTAVPWGVGVPGMGRNIYLGINYQF